LRTLKFILLGLILFVAPLPLLYGAERAVDAQDPLMVIRSYVRATYARDFVAAYRFISTEDRKVRELNRYRVVRTAALRSQRRASSASSSKWNC
jgi:hypothetical protein